MDKSGTCTECYTPVKCLSTGPTCITDCEGRSDGSYQICGNCTSFAVCLNGLMIIDHCPNRLIWNDFAPKGCLGTTITCIECFEHDQCNSTGPVCVKSCTGLPDGRYQSCDNCLAFATCTAGELTFDYCPILFRWDDNHKGCISESETCRACAMPDMCGMTGADCIQNCRGQDDGLYQFCGNCTSYISCNLEKTTYLHCTIPGTFWDNDVKGCLPVSNTCYHCYSPDGKSYFI